ncbi:SDR family oxidoreductase [Vibrio sp. JC009]|uniref:UDP-glucose 4-epimerase family protein n=1 Tax=Vibrio sp. JC009 TaxID=2912314 RepID=UPI0023B02B98|nr:SDR family oxidoreductase [Vibrio sp. JC009]WED22024.1 SDR family oxidoreductase [Vibrio sp. JC009]
MNILVTGSKGFVGSRVVELADARGWCCVGGRRQAAGGELVDTSNVVYRDVAPNEHWVDVLQGIDCVVHCAARVHQMKETESDVLEAYREVNTHGTLNLARQAADAGVKRFVFLSTVKVNGELTEAGKPFTPEVSIPPEDPYGLSKYEAELGLRKLADETGLEVVIIRPPLIYGPGVKANFLSMMNWVYKGVPLPLRSINNLRSMVFLDNLVDLILLSCEHPDAANKTFLVSDDQDTSLSSLLAMIASALDKPNRMIPFPASLLKLTATLLGKGDIGTRLCANLQVDISETKQALSWVPPYSVQEGIEQTVSDFLINNK